MCVCVFVCLCVQSGSQGEHYHLTTFILQVDRFKALRQPGSQNENTILAQIRCGLSPLQVPQKQSCSYRKRALIVPGKEPCE